MIVSGVDQQSAVDFVVTKFDDFKEARKGKEEVWLDCVKAYLSDFNPVWDAKAKKYKRSRRFVPLSFDAVESQHSMFMSMMFNGDNWLGFEPDQPGRLPHDDDAADQLTPLILKQIRHMGFEREFGILLKQIQICGNAPYTVGWRKDNRVDYPAYDKAMAEWTIRNRELWRQYLAMQQAWKVQAQQAVAQGQPPPPPPEHLMPEPPPVNQKIAECGPTFQANDIFNFVIDPFSTDRRRALRIKRTFVSKAVLRRMAQKNDWGYSVYSNVEKIREAEYRGQNQDDFEVDRYRAFGMDMPKSTEVELLEAWGTMEIPGSYDGSEEKTYVSHVCTVANRSTLIRFEPTFLWSGDAPVQLATYRDVPGQVYGIGQLEPLLGLQDLVNVRANQNVDIVAFTTNPEYKAVDDGIIKTNLVSAPNKVHLVGDINNLIPLEKNTQGLQLSFQDVEYLQREFGAMAKSQSPMGGKSSESATKSSLDAGAVNTDVAKIAAHIEDTVLFKTVDLFVQLNAQFLPKGTMVKSLQSGKVTFKEISPEVIRRGWLVKIRGSQYVADRQERTQNLMMEFQLFTGNPMIVPYVNILEFVKNIHQDNGFTDGDKVFNDAEKAQTIIAAMMQLGIFGNGGMAGQNGQSGEMGQSGSDAGESGGAGADAQAVDPAAGNAIATGENTLGVGPGYPQ